MRRAARSHRGQMTIRGVDGCLGRDQVQRGFTAPDGGRRKPAVERRQPAVMRHRQGQQVTICDLRCDQDMRGLDMRGIRQADVVGPEGVAGQAPQLGNNGADSGGGARRARIFRIADDADDAVLRQRAGRLGVAALVLEPTMGGIMRDMRRVYQGDEDIDVEQERHGASSRRALTVSSVTTLRLLRRGRSGMPLRIFGGCGR